MVTKGASVRDRGVESSYLEVGVGGGRAVPLHCNQPGGGHLRLTDINNKYRSRGKSVEFILLSNILESFWANLKKKWGNHLIKYDIF